MVVRLTPERQYIVVEYDEAKAKRLLEVKGAITLISILGYDLLMKTLFSFFLVCLLSRCSANNTHARKQLLERMERLAISSWGPVV